MVEFRPHTEACGPQYLQLHIFSKPADPRQTLATLKWARRHEQAVYFTHVYTAKELSPEEARRLAAQYAEASRISVVYVEESAELAAPPS